MLAGAAFYLTLAYFEATWSLLLDDLGGSDPNTVIEALEVVAAV